MSAIRLVDTRDMAREDWLEARKSGIGGSDAAAIAGLNPWKSPIAVYLEKTGEIESEGPGEAAYWGTRLEDLVAREFTRRTGIRVQRCNAILQHPEYPFMLANIDRRIVGTDEGPGVLECKTTSEWMRDAWDDDRAPDHYMIQMQHYLAVTGLSYGYIAVLIGGNKYRYMRIDRDEELISYLIEIEEEFWQRVESRNPPPFDGSEASGELLKRMYPEARREATVQLPGDAELLAAEYDIAQAEEKAAAERKDCAANQLKALLGECEIGILPRSGRLVSWKQMSSNRFDAKALQAEHPDLHAKFTKTSSYRRFTISSTSAKE